MADLPAHFFKFIPPGFKFNISIPKSFLTNLNGSSRWKKAILRRGRHKWAVHISDGGVFGDGWREFVTDNGVEELDFIIFKHQGNMVFECFVFDKSTCERHFPYPNILEDVKESLTESSDSLHIHIHKRSKKMVNKAVKMSEKNNYWSESKLDGDHCFVVIMTPYCIKAGRLHVPMKFANSNGLFSKRGSTEIVIVDEEQTSWRAKLKNRTTEIYLTGWRKVVLANQLNVGDVCKFELVKAGKVPRYNFYRKKKPTKDHVQVTKKTSSTMPKAACSSSTRYFISTLKAYCIRRSCLYFPNKFARKNGLFHKEEMILKNVNGSWWSVEIKNFKNRFCYIRQGWKAFCVANRLKKGQHFKLELMSNREKPVACFYSLRSR